MLVVEQERHGSLEKQKVNGQASKPKQGERMPKVGKKHYPYTKKGKMAAKKAAKRTGTTVRKSKSKY